MFENETLQDMTTTILLGNNDVLSAPLYLAVMLMDVFKDYLPIFLAVIIGLMGWQKLQGEQWKPVLTKGFASIGILLGSLFLTDSNTKIKMAGDEFKVPYIVKGERELIKMGMDLANDVKMTFLFGKPKVTTNSKGEKIKTWDYSKKGFLMERLDNQLEAALTQNDKTIEDINKSNANLESSREEVFKIVDTLLQRTGQSYFQYLNFNNIMDVKTGQTNGYRNIENDPIKFSERVVLLENSDIFTRIDAANPNSPVITYIPTFLDELSKVSAVADQWAETVEYDVTSKNKQLDKVLNKLVISLLGHSLNSKSESFYLPSGDGYLKSSTEKNTRTTVFGQDNVSSYNKETQTIRQKIMDNTGNEEIAKAVKEINSIFQSNVNLKDKAISDLRSIVSFYITVQDDARKIRNYCSATVTSVPNFNSIELPTGSKQKACKNSVVELRNNVNNKFLSFDKSLQKKEKTSLKKELPDVEQIFLKSPALYALQSFGDIAKLPSVNKIVELDQTVSTVTYDSLEKQLKETEGNPELKNINERNREIILDQYHNINVDIENVLNRYIPLKTVLVKTATLDAEQKNKDMSKLAEVFNREEYLTEIESMFKDESGNDNNWMQLGFTYGYLKDVSQTYTLFNLKKIDNSQTLEMKLDDIQKVQKIYSNEAIIDRTKSVVNVVSAINEFKNGLNSLFDGLKNPLSSTGKVLSGTLTSIGSVFIIAKHAIIQQLYVEAAGAIVVGVAYIIPALIWTIAVFVWIYKTSIILAILPLATFMVSYINFEQIKSAIMTLIHLLLTPVILVCMFFISVELANFIPLFIDKMMPILSIQEILELSKPINTYNNYAQEALKWAASFFEDESSDLGILFNIMIMVKILLTLLFQTMILLTAYLNTQEYLQMAIGSGGTNLSDGDRLQNKTLGVFRMV